MDLGSVLDIKELGITFQPLLLATVTFPGDGSILRLSTHDLSGPLQYNGNTYLPKIVNQNIAAAQALSELGIDTWPDVTIRLADPEGYVWNNWAQVYQRGFTGATLQLRIIFADLKNKLYSSDSIVIFSGTCGNYVRDQGYGSFKASSLQNIAKFSLPVTRIQRRCPWDFPATSADRFLAAYPVDNLPRCLYSVDAGGANARGNLDPATSLPFTSCDFTNAACVARLGNSSGLIHIDTSGRPTGSFGGITWEPPIQSHTKGFISGKWEDGFNNNNSAKYGDFISLVYGTCLVNPLQINSVGDANLTAMEAVFCLERVASISNIVINDVNISRADQGGSLIAGFWGILCDGSPFGIPNQDTFYDGKGDPYGNMAAITARVPKTLQDASGIANIRGKISGPGVRVYTADSPLSITANVGAVITVPSHGYVTGDIVLISGVLGNTAVNGQWKITVLSTNTFSLNGADASGTYTSLGQSTRYSFSNQFTSNPIWTLMDILRWCGKDYSQIKIGTAITSAAFCDVQINFNDLNGVVSQHQRFDISLVIKQRRSASEIIRGLRNAYRGTMVSGINGLIELGIRGTLADQQPAPIPGSNYNVAIPSIKADGTAASGYVAYRFSKVLKDQDGNSTLKVGPPPLASLLTQLTCSIYDKDRQYSPDSLTENDPEAQKLYGQEIPQNFAAEGINSYDQVARVFKSKFDEVNRGNRRNASGVYGVSGDPGGTDIVEWQTTVFGIHLAIDNIVMIDDPQAGLSGLLVRLSSISPEINYRTCTFKGSVHCDQWYLDINGQGIDPGNKYQGTSPLVRPPFALRGNITAPHVGDALYDSTELFFGLAQASTTLTDGSAGQSLTVTFDLPVTAFSALTRPPNIAAQQGLSSVDVTNGHLPGGRTIYTAICAKDATGDVYGVSAPSLIIENVIPAGSATNDVTTPTIYWAPGTVGYVFLAGYDPMAMTVQDVQDSTPATIVLKSLKLGTAGSPDTEAAIISLRPKIVAVAGCCRGFLTHVTGTTLEIAGSLFATNRWAGYDCSVIGFPNELGEIPIANFTIASNTGAVLTLSGSSPNAISAGVARGDLLVILSKATVAGDVLTDANWDNELALINAASVLGATNASPIVISVTDPHGLSTGDNVRIDGAAGNTAANGVSWPIIVVDAYSYSLTGSTGNGDYVANSANVQKRTGGLVPEALVGKQVLVIAGMGRGQAQPILDNDATSITTSPFVVSPDSTSRYIVVEKEFLPSTDTSALNVSQLFTTASIAVPVTNLKDQIFVLIPVMLDSNKQESFFYLDQVRMICQFGSKGLVPILPPNNWLPGGAPQELNADITADNSFRIVPDYEGPDANLNFTPLMRFGGYQPINVPSTVALPPTIGAVTTSFDGSASLPPGDYRVALSVFDDTSSTGSPGETDLSDVILITVPVGQNKITISGITYSAHSDSLIAWIALRDSDLSVCVATSIHTIPSSIDLKHLVPKTVGPVDENYDHLHLQAKYELVPGVWQLPISDASDPTVLTFAPAALFPTNLYAGYVVSLMNNVAPVVGNTTPQVMLDVDVASNDGATLTPTGALPSSYVPVVGDIWVMRAKITVLSDSSYQDVNFANTATAVTTGLVPNSCVGGYNARVIGGAGAGQPEIPVASNTADTIVVVSPFNPPIDATSIIVVVYSAWAFEIDCAPVVTKTNIPPAFGVPEVGVMRLANVSGKIMLFTAIAQASDGSSAAGPPPFREGYIAGMTGGAAGADPFVVAGA